MSDNTSAMDVIVSAAYSKNVKVKHTASIRGDHIIPFVHNNLGTFENDDQVIQTSPYVYEIDAYPFVCPETSQKYFADLIYVNPNNGQMYWFCKPCYERHEHDIDDIEREECKQAHYYKLTRLSRREKAMDWHEIKDPLFRYTLNPEFIEDIQLDKYHKLQTDHAIMECVNNEPGINHYQLVKATGLSKGKVSRGVARLKDVGLVRTRKVGKAICIYPNKDKIGMDFTI